MLRREYLGFGVSESGISPYVETSLFPCQCVMHLGASNPLTVCLARGFRGLFVGYHVTLDVPV